MSNVNKLMDQLFYLDLKKLGGEVAFIKGYLNLFGYFIEGVSV